MFSSQTTASLVLLFLSALTPTNATTGPQAPDGAIVPFTSQLPACASQCGPLYDVQGGCLTGDAKGCFCADARLTTIVTVGATAVSQICGSRSCTAEADLGKVVTWYKSFCGKSGTVVATSAAPGKTSAPGAATGSNAGDGSLASVAPSGGSWWSGHWKWVVMLVVLVVVIVGGWIGACIWRRSYLRKRERQFEMRPPVLPFAPSGPELHMPGGQGRGTPGTDPEKGGWLRKKSRV